MFFGEYRHQFDEKFRFRIPAKFKELLGERPFIMRGSNKSLIILKADAAQAMLENQQSGVDMYDPVNNLPLRLLTSSAFFAEEDKQGRILMPLKLLEHAQFKSKSSDITNKNIVTIGVLNRVEMWCEEEWDKYSDVDATDFDNYLAQSVKAKRETAL